MVDISKNGGQDAAVSLAHVARRTGLSRGYLEQLAGALRNARLLRGRCGKQGGYQLARGAQEITIRSVVEAAIGPINIVECVDDPASCMNSDFCECRPVYALINRAVTGALERFTLHDLQLPEALAAVEREGAKLGGSATGPGCPAPSGASPGRR